MNGVKLTGDINQHPWLNAWEVGKWLGMPTENILTAWEDRTIPPPRVLWPLRWHEDDLIEHMAQQQEGYSTCNATD